MEVYPESLEILRNMMKSEQKECSFVVYCSVAVNGIYLKLNRCIVADTGKGTSLCFLYRAPFDKKYINAY